MKAAIAWSGGKDSCLALYRALSNGVKVAHLFNFVHDDGSRTMSHGLKPGLIEAQAAALKLPLLLKRVNWGTYERGFAEALEELKDEGVDTLINGDIDLPEGVAWNHKMCAAAGIELMMPLENADPEGLLAEFIRAGFKAVIVCVRSDTPARDWLGYEIDGAFVELLRGQKPGSIHFCGELGEFHTLVTDGPLFDSRIEIVESQKVDLDGHLRLNISRYEVIAKDSQRST